MGEKYGNGNTIFSPINFFTSFSVTSRKKTGPGGKINTIQHGQGEKHRLRIFSPSTPPAKVEQLIAWPRREKMKTQGEKIKTQWEK